MTDLMIDIQLINSVWWKPSSTLVVWSDVSIAAYARFDDDCSARVYSRTAASTWIFESFERRRKDDASGPPSKEEAGRSPTIASMNSCGLGPLSFQDNACRTSISMSTSSSIVYRPWHISSATKSIPNMTPPRFFRAMTIHDAVASWYSSLELSATLALAEDVAMKRSRYDMPMHAISLSLLRLLKSESIIW